ncbi:potassium transporter [Penicillium macrosclerotiorum]|uniref:potassium transporter n=1 Tax=Penicillium macrosclerotiorum TaxID=303699 RepID=UPI002549BCA1|nr:potassium transporter [Penicillium macrosclerotiorum]KAJ5698379.1 potassium transporter [Penicillium macrosclerotiorum]
MWGGFELASIKDQEIKDLPIKFRALDGLFQALVSTAIRSILIPSSKTVAVCKQPDMHSCIEVNSCDSSYSFRGSKSPILVRGYFIYNQIRSQFNHDIWWLSLAVLVITIVESTHYNSHPVEFSTFNIIFEIVSAYSCVGMSIGFPGRNYSFCGEWHSISKILLIAVSLRGRHRSLPIFTDKLTCSRES